MQNEDGTTANGLRKVDPAPGSTTWELVDAQAGLVRHRQRYRGNIINNLR